MADIPSNNPISGGEPMKKSTGRVQPKKETVRINLPPKPTAAPTIKLPTLPPGGPTGAPIPVAPLPRTPAPATAAAPRAAAPAAPSIQRAAPVAAPTVSTFDKILAMAAAIVAVGAVATTVWMMLILKDAVNQ
jgi:hypothetical protein